MDPPAMASAKTLAETPNLASIPSSYIFSGHSGPADAALQSVDDDSIPIIDFSLLTTGTPDQRAKVVDELGKVCQDWGFFMVMNHGVEERVMKEMMDICREFFDQTEEEKREYETNHAVDPIKYGTSFNPQKEKVLFWRDYLRILVHPNFHSPAKPPRFREILEEYCKRSIETARELVRGISESLGLESCDLERAVDFESCSGIFAANFYPPCPQPELARGLPTHSDPYILTLLFQNQISGLQILHQGKWLNVNPINPNSFMVTVSDQLEILSNGKYKSVLHRAMVNNKATRMSIGIAVGPSLETMVGPAPQLLNKLTNPPLFKHIKYKDYMQMLQSSNLQPKACLDRIRLL